MNPALQTQNAETILQVAKNMLDHDVKKVGLSVGAARHTYRQLMKKVTAK